MGMHKMHQGNVHDLPVRNNVCLLLSAVLMQARIDCDIVRHHKDYYTSGRTCALRSDQIGLSYDNLKWFINEPGIIEAFASWQDEIQPEAIREELRRALA